MLIESLGGDVMGTIPLGDIVLYLNPLHIFLFVTILVFTALIAMSRTETQVEAMFGSLDEKCLVLLMKIRLQLAKRNSSIEDSWLLSAV